MVSKYDWLDSDELESTDDDDELMDMKNYSRKSYYSGADISGCEVDDLNLVVTQSASFFELSEVEGVVEDKSGHIEALPGLPGKDWPYSFLRDWSSAVIVRSLPSAGAGFDLLNEVVKHSLSGCDMFMNYEEVFSDDNVWSNSETESCGSELTDEYELVELEKSFLRNYYSGADISDCEVGDLDPDVTLFASVYKLCEAGEMVEDRVSKSATWLPEIELYLERYSHISTDAERLIFREEVSTDADEAIYAFQQAWLYLEREGYSLSAQQRLLQRWLWRLEPGEVPAAPVMDQKDVGVLDGLFLAFGMNNAGPGTPIWETARALGATLLRRGDGLLDNCTTHVIAAGDHPLVSEARRMGKLVVLPSWVFTCAQSGRRQDESDHYMNVVQERDTGGVDDQVVGGFCSAGMVAPAGVLPISPSSDSDSPDEADVVELYDDDTRFATWLLLMEELETTLQEVKRCLYYAWSSAEGPWLEVGKATLEVRCHQQHRKVPEHSELEEYGFFSCLAIESENEDEADVIVKLTGDECVCDVAEAEDADCQLHMSVTGRDRIGGSCSASTAQDGTGRKGIARQRRISIVKWKNVTDFVRSHYVYFAVLNTVCITVCNAYIYI